MYVRLGDHVRNIVIDDGHHELYLNEIAAQELALRINAGVNLLGRAVEIAADAS